MMTRWECARAFAALASLLLLAQEARAQENIDPADDGHQYCWGENVGWINAEPQGNGGPGLQVGDFGVTGWMWGENIGWISLSCSNTASCGVSPYGVVNDGFGRLSGFAWSENMGWVNFSPMACLPDPTCGVWVDPVTGYFFGRAWGENMGWVTFASTPPTGETVRTSWCSGTASAPGSTPPLTVDPSGVEFVLEWGALGGAGWYDVVGGSVTTLRATGGDFTAATRRCIASRTTATSAPIVGPAPMPGEVHWYLVHGANCRGKGSYDSGSPSQAGSRDAEIAVSVSGCP